VEGIRKSVGICFGVCFFVGSENPDGSCYGLWAPDWTVEKRVVVEIYLCVDLVSRGPCALSDEVDSDLSL
jgi:hypothetical protein